jgi:thiosulfate reductase cytochrome b subunit
MPPSADAPSKQDGPLYYRHTLPVRVMHWINVIALTILFMSGLNIFNAHPALYWGKSSYAGSPPILELEAKQEGSGELTGVTRVFGHEFNTTGVGASKDGWSPDGAGFHRGLRFPITGWLSMARAWHFFFA